MDNIQTITSSHTPIILIENYRDHPEEFQKIHLEYVGSSTIAALAGLNKWRSPLQVWMEMRGLVAPTEESFQMFAGSKIEGVIPDLFERKTGQRIFRNDVVYSSTRAPWACATPDFYDSEGGIVEAKTHGAWAEKFYAAGDIPDSAHIQVIWQMGITGNHRGRIAALYNTHGFSVHDIEYSPQIFEQLVGYGEKFMQLVADGTPPDARAGDSDLIDDLYKLRADKAELSAEYLQLCEEYLKKSEISAEAKRAMDDAKAEVKAVELKIRQALAGAEAGRCGHFEIGQKLVSVKESVHPAYSYTKFRIRPLKEEN